MRWFISALIILGLLAGSLYAVNLEDKYDIRNHPQPHIFPRLPEPVCG